MNTNQTTNPAADSNVGGLLAKWRAAVEKELQGAPFDKKLVATLPEGIRVQPLYTPSDAGRTGNEAARRGLARPVGQGWDIAQVYRKASAAEFNASILDALNRGQNAVVVRLDAATRAGIDVDAAPESQVGADGVSLNDLKDWTKALEKVALDAVPVHVEAGAAALPSASLYLAAAKKAGIAWERLTGSLTSDPLRELALSGKLPASLDSLWADQAGWTLWASSQAPRLATAGVDASLYADSGANAVQELALALASVRETLSALLEKGVPAVTAVARIRTTLSAGPDFFVEVAKFRAWREVWTQLLEGYGVASVLPRVHARTSAWNKSSLDAETNLLRVTTEALAAVIGGIDSLEITPFDSLWKQDNELSGRLARNLHTMLAEEFQVKDPIDAVGGSWYVEALTTELAQKAWAQFQTIEKDGGLVAALRGGSIQAMLAASRKDRVDAVDKRRAVYIGVNQFPNAKDTPKTVEGIPGTALGARKAEVAARRTSWTEAKPASWPGLIECALSAVGRGATQAQVLEKLVAAGAPTTLPEPVTQYRVAEGFEKLRNRMADLASKGKRPKVLLAKMGPVLQHKARADFSAGFFSAGGFELLAKETFENGEQVAAAATKAGARIVVLCSTDDTYPALVPELAKAVKAAPGKPTLVLAGYPTEHVEAFKQLGVDEFIHIRANVRQTLETILEAALSQEDKR
ncbi:MAG: methylmalonyl-CoA mutase family protein [Opitutaceae bacterium]|nr:methylmalonyl-CoA mutase family protein [Opitutaceae bacterium]